MKNLLFEQIDMTKLYGGEPVTDETILSYSLYILDTSYEEVKRVGGARFIISDQDIEEAVNSYEENIRMKYCDFEASKLAPGWNIVSFPMKKLKNNTDSEIDMSKIVYCSVVPISKIKNKIDYTIHNPMLRKERCVNDI